MNGTILSFSMTSSSQLQEKKVEQVDSPPPIFAMNSFSEQQDLFLSGGCAIPNSEEFMIKILHIPEIHALKLPSGYLNLFNCIENVNSIVPQKPYFFHKCRFELFNEEKKMV